MQATQRRSDEATKGKKAGLAPRAQFPFPNFPASPCRSIAPSLLSPHIPSSLRRSVAPSLSLTRSAFSFAEVMFAVVILGIGFIMVAAVFPVAIKQGQANSEESVTAAVARNGANYLDPLGQRDPVTFASGAIVPTLFGTDLMITAAAANPPKGTAEAAPPALQVPAQGSLTSRGKLIALGDLRLYEDGDAPLIELQRREGTGNMIVSNDNRFAWVPMYRRDRVYTNRTDTPLPITDPRVTYEDAPIAQVVMFGVEVRNRTEFGANDLPKVQETTGQRKQWNLQPRPVAIRIRPERDYLPSGSLDNYVVEFTSVANLAGDHPRGGFPAGGDYNNILNAAPNAIAEGSFFVISDDRIVRDAVGDPLSARVAGKFNGRIYRVGAQRTDLGANVWDFYPGYEFSPDAGADGLPNNNLVSGSTARPKDDVTRIGVDGPGTAETINGITYYSEVKVDGAGASEGAVAFIMGKGLSEAYMNPIVTNGPPQFEGLPMDVSVYTTVTKVK